MVEWEDIELTFPHKHIKNARACGAALTENKLGTARRTQLQPKL